VGLKPRGGAGGSSGPPVGLQSEHGTPAPLQPSCLIGWSECSSQTQRSPRHNLQSGLVIARSGRGSTRAAQVHNLIRRDFRQPAASSSRKLTMFLSGPWRSISIALRYWPRRSHLVHAVARQLHVREIPIQTIQCRSQSKSARNTTELLIAPKAKEGEGSSPVRRSGRRLS
jgi:hypothetical protein